MYIIQLQLNQNISQSRDDSRQLISSDNNSDKIDVDSGRSKNLFMRIRKCFYFVFASLLFSVLTALLFLLLNIPPASCS